MKVDLKAQPAGVMVRFRTASGQRFAGAPGWELDDIELVGISSKPFWSFVEHADQCDTKGPTAFAGDPVTVKSKQTVSLAGTASHPSDLPVELHWTQVGGPAVQLTGFTSPSLSFEAPDVGTQTVVLTFALRADDGALLSPASQVEVTVVPADPGRVRRGRGRVHDRPARGGTLLGLLRRAHVRDARSPRARRPRAALVAAPSSLSRGFCPKTPRTDMLSTWWTPWRSRKGSSSSFTRPPGT